MCTQVDTRAHICNMDLWCTVQIIFIIIEVEVETEGACIGSPPQWHPGNREGIPHHFFDRRQVSLKMDNLGSFSGRILPSPLCCVRLRHQTTQV